MTQGDVTPVADERPSLAAAIGQRVHELRTGYGLTQDEVARGCQQAGAADWKANRIGLIEAGAAAPTLTNLLTVALGLAMACGQVVRLADLLPEQGTAPIGRDFTVGYPQLRAVLSGGPVNPLLMFRPLPKPERMPGWGSADDKAVEELGQEPWHVLAAAESLWGKGATVSTERDRRAGPDATPQKRGRITRELLPLVAEEAARLLAEEIALDGMSPLPGGENPNSASRGEPSP